MRVPYNVAAVADNRHGRVASPPYFEFFSKTSRVPGTRLPRVGCSFVP